MWIVDSGHFSALEVLYCIMHTLNMITHQSWVRDYMGLLTDFRIIRIEFLTREMAEKGELFVFLFVSGWDQEQEQGMTLVRLCAEGG